MSRRNTWHLPGPVRGKDPAGLEDALARLHLADDRPPTEADRPPVSTFPLTRAARAALRLGRGVV